MEQSPRKPMNIIGAIILAFLAVALSVKVFTFLVTIILGEDLGNILGLILAIILGLYVYDRLRSRKFGFSRKRKEELTREAPKV